MNASGIPGDMSAVERALDQARPNVGVCLASTSLADLLAQARAVVLREGVAQQTQRGPTRSLGGVLLTWLDPERDTSTPGQWSFDDIAWYLEHFVAARPENDPARRAARGALVFPYTYAARARFWDGGWGYTQALVAALGEAGLSVAGMTSSRDAFTMALAALGERLHLQTILSLCALYPPRLLAAWLANPALVGELCARWRRDLLAAAIADVAAAPASRRAVVSALCYPHLEEQLQPRMGLPPYQLFQLLPGAADEPINSIHVHRSLDVDGGVPLDFHHDLAWLREASARLDRPVGSITIVAHNLHAYERAPEAADETIQSWLCRVTDGYATGAGAPHALLDQPDYQANVARIWARWQEEHQ